MQYDFALTPLGGQIINAKGRFFKYRAGNGLIRVKLTDGGVIDLLPGQGVSNRNFESIEIVDKSGAANSGTILAGDFDFRDERITGTVDVVDGGKFRTKAQIAYGSSVRNGNVAAQFSNVQLWNPVGSGRNLVVEAIGVVSALGGTIAVVIPMSAALLNLRGTPASKLVLAGATASVAQTRYENTGVANNADATLHFAMAANSNVPKNFAEPMVITPGNGLNVAALTANIDIGANFEYYEEPV